MSTKKPQPGETLGLSDTLEGIALVVRAFYGEEREVVKSGDHWRLKSPTGNVMQLSFVYEKNDTFYFAALGGPQ